MTREEIAKNINGVKDLARTLSVNYELDFEEGKIYDNRNKIESWADRDKSTRAFVPENDNSITYVLYCNKVPCHVVDYENEEELEALGAADCEHEAECLVLPEIKMMITYVSSEDDFKEMGYYIVEMDCIK